MMMYFRVCRRPADTRAQHVFVVEPAGNLQSKFHTFAAVTEEEMKVTMTYSLFSFPINMLILL
jgi:hypothetical protein